MQDTQQTPEILGFDRYLIYEVTVPRSYWNQEVEDKLLWQDPSDFLTQGNALLGIWSDGFYEEPIHLTAVNNRYSLHPGTARYLLNRITSEMPPLKGLVVNRYGTTKEMIEDTFSCEATLYEKSFDAYMQFKYKFGKQGHGIKMFRRKNKSDWDLMVHGYGDESKRHFLQGFDTTIRFTHKGKHLVDYGLNSTPTIEKEVNTLSEYAEVLLEVFG